MPGMAKSISIRSTLSLRSGSASAAPPLPDTSTRVAAQLAQRCRGDDQNQAGADLHCRVWACRKHLGLERNPAVALLTRFIPPRSSVWWQRRCVAGAGNRSAGGPMKEEGHWHRPEIIAQFDADFVEVA